MSKVFNVNGSCKPNIHYMVDISGRLKEIKTLIDEGKYFTINRARQYGKTTILRALTQFLRNEYLVVSLDFQKLGDAKFKSENTFSTAFAKIFVRAIQNSEPELPDHLQKVVTTLADAAKHTGDFELLELFTHLNEICATAEKPVVLMIDEVDSATNNQVFLDFLAQLRACYLEREDTPTFQSVILAGVYDVKNLKRKLRPEDEHKVNSPWNIAADFEVVLSFSADEIEGMLRDYSLDRSIAMNTAGIAKLIYDYTSGYPFLVSRICKIIDEMLVGNADFPTCESAWTYAGVLEAVKILLSEKNTLFESLMNKIDDYPNLKEFLYSLLFSGKNIAYNPDDPAIDIAMMFGFVKIENGNIFVANRIFETRIYNRYLTSSDVQSKDIYRAALQDKNQFVQNGHLNMDLVLQKFVTHFTDIYGDYPERFLEEDGRRIFLMYLKPIINGTGNYYIEAQTRNMERTDVVVDYHSEQFIIEMKIWRGNSYHERGEKQLTEYLDYYHLDKGYMLSFNFNKNKQPGLSRINLGDKVLVEAVV